ncbi:hypothetical protein HC928_08675 [bacterium]|nr:hypothetical protein [bacterium]
MQAFDQRLRDVLLDVEDQHAQRQHEDQQDEVENNRGDDEEPPDRPPYLPHGVCPHCRDS